ncbi:MAG: hypothetical protein ACHQ51_11190 [Elusimicrobiota bacterium]
MKNSLRLALALALIAPGPFAGQAAAQVIVSPRSIPAGIGGPVGVSGAPAMLAPALSSLALSPSAGLGTSALPAAAPSALYAAPSAAAADGPSRDRFSPAERASLPAGVWAKTKKLLRDTPAEIAILGTVGLLIGLGAGWHHEAAREASIPVGFSEIHQMEREAEAEGRAIGTMTRYLAGTNDMAMNVFNAWNIANERTLYGSPVPAFASELDYNAGQKLRIHKYELPHYFQSIPVEAAAARGMLESYDQVRRQAADAGGHLSRTWDESHHDVTHTEYDTHTVDDGNGKSHTETTSHEVYDYTNHHYSYDRGQGEASSSSLDALTLKGRAASFTETIPVAKQTNADGEYAAEKSRGLKRAITPEEALKYSRAWRDGSTLMTNLPTIHGRLADLARDADQWRADKTRAHDEAYRTYSHSDSGPKEYQTAERALAHDQELERSTAEILDGVDYAKAMTPVLQAKINELIAVQLDHKPGDAKALTKEVLTIAKTIYTKNFKNGFDVERFRAGVVALGALLGALLGGLLGWGADWAGNRRGWWR